MFNEGSNIVPKRPLGAVWGGFGKDFGRIWEGLKTILEPKLEELCYIGFVLRKIRSTQYLGQYKQQNMNKFIRITFFVKPLLPPLAAVAQPYLVVVR